MFSGFATFLKKGSAKNFPEGKVLAHTHSSPKEIENYVHLANIDPKKFLVKFFSKNLRGFGAEPHRKQRFLFAKLFLLRLRCQKKKRLYEVSLCLGVLLLF